MSWINRVAISIFTSNELHGAVVSIVNIVGNILFSYEWWATNVGNKLRAVWIPIANSKQLSLRINIVRPIPNIKLNKMPWGCLELNDRTAAKKLLMNIRTNGWGIIKEIPWIRYPLIVSVADA